MYGSYVFQYVRHTLKKKSQTSHGDYKVAINLSSQQLTNCQAAFLRNEWKS